MEKRQKIWLRTRVWIIAIQCDHSKQQTKNWHAILCLYFYWMRHQWWGTNMSGVTTCNGYDVEWTQLQNQRSSGWISSKHRQSNDIIGIWFLRRFYGYMRSNWIKFQLKILHNLVFVCHCSHFLFVDVT